jgi:hypothetical protein
VNEKQRGSEDLQKNGVVVANTAIDVLVVTQLHAGEVRGCCRSGTSGLPDLVSAQRLADLIVVVRAQMRRLLVVQVRRVDGEDESRRYHLSQLNESPVKLFGAYTLQLSSRGSNINVSGSFDSEYSSTYFLIAATSLSAL